MRGELRRSLGVKVVAKLLGEKLGNKNSNGREVMLWKFLH